MSSTGGRDNRKKGNQKTKDDERHVTELSKLVQSKASKEVMFEQFNLQADVQFHQKIKAHQGVFNYTSKLSAEIYFGNVFLKPDWRLFSFHISRQQVACLFEIHQDLERVIEALLDAHIQKIESLLQKPTRKRQEQPIPLLTLSMGNWQLVEGNQTLALLQIFEHRIVNVPRQNIRFFKTTLPFYSDAELIALYSLDSTHREHWTYYLSTTATSPESPPSEESTSQFYSLNGLSAPIYECNQIIPLLLNQSNILDYLAFFCFFLQGERGSFYIIPAVKDAAIPEIIWDAHFVHNNTHLDLLAKFKSPRVLSVSEDSYQCEATIYCGSSIAIVKMEVLQTGQVTLKQSNEICDLLPFRLEIDL